jgi:hypothetical protein
MSAVITPTACRLTLHALFAIIRTLVPSDALRDKVNYAPEKEEKTTNLKALPN